MSWWSPLCWGLWAAFSLVSLAQRGSDIYAFLFSAARAHQSRAVDASSSPARRACEWSVRIS